MSEEEILKEKEKIKALQELVYQKRKEVAELEEKLENLLDDFTEDEEDSDESNNDKEIG